MAFYMSRSLCRRKGRGEGVLSERGMVGEV